MCYWVSDTPYQVLTAVASRKQMQFLSTHISDFNPIQVRKTSCLETSFIHVINLLSAAAPTLSYYNRRDRHVAPVAQYSFILSLAAVSYKLCLGRGHS